MTLSELVEKAKTTTKKWWKWILGGVIALVVILVLWKLRKQANEIARLKAEVTKDKELVKDLEARAKTEKNAATAKMLRDEAAKITADITVREIELAKREKETNEAIKKAESAKTWDELDAQAKGGPK